MAELHLAKQYYLYWEPPCHQSWLGKWSEQSSDWFDELQIQWIVLLGSIFMGVSSSNYEFVELIIRPFGGGLAPFSKTVISLLRTPYHQSWLGKWSEHSFNWFDELTTQQTVLLGYISLGLCSWNYEFFKMLIRPLGGGLAPSSQTVVSLLRTPCHQSWLGKWSEYSSNGFDELQIQWTVLLGYISLGLC